MIKKCCVCSKVKMEGEWQSGILILSGSRISHAYCPTCFTQTMARIKRTLPGPGTDLNHRAHENVMYGT